MNKFSKYRQLSEMVSSKTANATTYSLNSARGANVFRSAAKKYYAANSATKRSAKKALIRIGTISRSEKSK